jgi:hypothetical protein
LNGSIEEEKKKEYVALVCVRVIIIVDEKPI